jgi:hypothetical protein
MAKVNVDASEFPYLVICLLLDKMMHPDEVCSMNKDFNEYADKLKGKGMKPISLNAYLSMNALYRVYYKRIKKIFSYDTNQSMIIYIWPTEKDKEDSEKKDSIIKRAIRKLLMKEDLNTEETKLLREVIEEENEV